MGFQEKPQIEVDDGGGCGGVVEIPQPAEPKKWVVSNIVSAAAQPPGIQLRAPLKPILIACRSSSGCGDNGGRGEELYGRLPTTPTSAESRIPAKLPCPPAPRKRKASSSSWKCGLNGVREFFNPPDLETVFIRRHAERARASPVIGQHVHKIRLADSNPFFSPN
ncbi:hypothetical protein Dimus_015130 [Dionaea muscipula]